MANFTGVGAPTKDTIGSVGDVYTNSNNELQYECVSVISIDDSDDPAKIIYEWDLIIPDTGTESGDSNTGDENVFRKCYSLSLIPYLFTKSTLVLNLDNAATLNNLWYARNTKESNAYVNHLTINCPNKVIGCQYMLSSAYSYDYTMKEVVFNVDVSEAKTFQRAFGRLYVLNKIGGIPLNLTSATTLANIFDGLNELEEVRFAQSSIYINLPIPNSPLLSDSSIQSIIDGLADLTDGTSQTLTLHTDVKTKLTEEQIATITSKNWTLA